MNVTSAASISRMRDERSVAAAGTGCAIGRRALVGVGKIVKTRSLRERTNEVRLEQVAMRQFAHVGSIDVVEDAFLAAG